MSKVKTAPPDVSREETIAALVAGKLRFHELSSDLSASEAAAIRRAAIERLTGARLDAIGSYSFDEATFTYNTNPAKRVYERFTWNPMQFYDGTKQAVSAAIGVRGGSHLSTELSVSRNDVKMPFGNFVSNLGILRVDYAMSPRATLRSLTQYNSLTHEVTNSVRLNFIYRPGSDLYVVYNDLQQTGLPTDVFRPSDRQIVVKLNYLLAR